MALYWCFQCERQTPGFFQAGSEIPLCSFCHGEFIEEIENTNPPSPAVSSSPLPLPLAGLFGVPFPLVAGPTAASNGGQMPRLISIINPIIGAVAAEQSEVRPVLRNRNPMLVIEGDLSGLGMLGLGVGPQTLRGRIGDYVMGSDLDRLIQMLSENDPNRYGTPPAAKSAVEAMPTLKIEADIAHAVQCAVCKEDFETGEEVRQMPCKHLYHTDCILPWLSQHCTCPVCRYQMPSEEEREEETRGLNQTGAASVSTVASSEEAGAREAQPISNSTNASEDSSGNNNDQNNPALLPMLFQLLSSLSSQPMFAPTDSSNINPTRSDSGAASPPASRSSESLSGMKQEEMD